MVAPPRLPSGALQHAIPRIDAKFFRGLSDPTRLGVLEVLFEQGETSVSRLVEVLDLPRTRVATHLACLRDCGYVSVRREGRFHFYSVADHRVRDILSLARSLSTEHEDAIACCQIIEGFTADLLLAPRQREESFRIITQPRRAEDASKRRTLLSFGAWLHERMQERGMSPKALAEALDISVAAVHRWLYRGGSPVPTIRPMLADVLGVPVDEVRATARSYQSGLGSPFATWLDQELQQRDWTRAELARRLGLEFHAIGPWFRKGVQPRPSTLKRLAAELEVAEKDIPRAC